MLETISTKDLELLEILPEVEVAVFKAYYLGNYTQTELAKHLETTQANVSYMILKCKKRIDFLKRVKLFSVSEIKEVLSPHFEPLDLDILVLMRLTTCQSDTAKALGITQGKVRHRFFKAIDHLERLVITDMSIFPYFLMFFEISNNFNILKEVGRRIQGDLRGFEGFKTKVVV